ncbi:terminase large subunit, partial [Streptococcus pneumoniae]|uniref:terminase large subunit n=1 Tax=Streptococcus pneumoniae TaxID=1313 RepID=UPI001293F29C
MAGVSKLQGYAIYVHPDCKNIMDEFYSYCYQRDKEGNWLNKPEDKNNHLMDALRYTRRNVNAPNYKTVANHAKDIADTATGYFMGNPIKYNNTADGDIDELLTAFDGAEIDQVDAQNALNMAIYGRAYEYIYAKEGMAE